MKREMGKWLMDVAKYMFTAMLISTIFADMEDPIIIYCAVFSAFILLFWGWNMFGSSFKKTKTTNNEYNNHFRLFGLVCNDSWFVLYVSR